MATWCRPAAKASVLLLLNFLTARAAFGATFVVTSTADSGPGSLRDAIQHASPGDIVDIGVTGTITLTTGPLSIATGLTILGPGAQHLAIDGGHASRVFTIGDATTGAFTPIDVTISGLTIRNGSSHTGGGILNGGRLTLSNTIVSGNAALHAAGIYSGWGSTLNVISSVVSGNVAGYRGGGIFAESSTLTLIESTISGNTASVGGGLNVFDCATSLTRVTVSHNSADGAYGGFGGGIASAGTYDVSGTLDVLDSTISDNFASSQAGGLFQATGFALVNNSTFAGNWCSASSGGCTAGAIYNQVARVRIANSTLAANVSPVGGNITSMWGTTTVRNSILAKRAGANCYFSSTRAIGSEGHNLSDDSSCSPVFTAASDRHDTPAGLSLDGLQDNGGPTRTIQLLASSPALDAVPLEACTDAGAALTTDQRGVTRPQGAGCDIGAFERVPSPYVAAVVQPIKADGTSVFSANRGVVPVKFTLTSDGMPTCQLPTATVSVARIAGAVVGPVTESDYLLGADDGVNFRVDAASCQYLYNLGSRSLGAGTYTVSISIDRALVGTGTFGIR